MMFKPVLIRAILEGRKTVTRRPARGVPLTVGKVVSIQPGMARPSIGRIKIVSVDRRVLDHIDDADAVREGFVDRQAFVDYWRELYGGVFNRHLHVMRYEFELVEQTGRVCDCCNGKGVLPPITATELSLLHLESNRVR